MWLSWWSSCFQFQRSAVRIPSSAKKIIEHFTVNCIEKMKIKKKRTGMAHFLKKQLCFRVGALVCWLWETTLVQKVAGWNPGTVYWLDIEFLTLICCRNCIVCLKRPKINKKRDRGWPIKRPFRFKNLRCNMPSQNRSLQQK